MKSASKFIEMVDEKTNSVVAKAEKGPIDDFRAIPAEIDQIPFEIQVQATVFEILKMLLAVNPDRDYFNRILPVVA